MKSLRITGCLLNSTAPLQPRLATRLYATQTGLGTAGAPSKPKRKAVTAFNDDGRVAWGDLTGREKTARATQQTFNFSFIILGAAMTGGVVYVLYTHVFSPESVTNHFNRAVRQVKAEQRCIQLLGSSNKITAYGEPTSNKWAKSRPIASSVKKDQRGVEHLVMHFNVEGPLDKGVVNLHMIKRPSDSEFAYKYLALDVKGHQRIYLENADAVSDGSAKSKTKLFGVSWR